MLDVNDYLKYKDNYSENQFWDKIKDNLISIGKDLIEKALVLFYSGTDSNTPTMDKMLIFSVLGYLILPIDLVPDVTPAVGYSDDLAGILAVLAKVSDSVTKEHTQQAQEKLQQLFDSTGSEEVEQQPEAQEINITKHETEAKNNQKSGKEPPNKSEEPRKSESGGFLSNIEKMVGIANGSADLIRKLIILGIFAAIAYFGYAFYHKDSQPVITSTLISERVKHVKELTTLKYHYKDILMIEKNKETDFIPFNYARLIVSYEGMAVLGVELDNIKVDISGNKIMISGLGNVKFIAHDINDNSLKVYDETARIFTKDWDIKTFSDLKAKQRTQIEHDIMNGSSLPEEARQTAEKAIVELIELIPGVKGKYDIQFEKVEMQKPTQPIVKLQEPKKS
ncbi:DUF4230 domain-containing protein [Actinobacillus equuli subsp. equuli]|uniref:DUF4230 domain-containing protein n=1 Tax=Actinobacillus equuli TaxID=718 RepID=UPI0024435BFE|nr:DUF4230 domain-containing protein [Actinobacillus equuli]WGE54086.1 DUF4230 domain-containing protein [Actinobacillus equuli subsp. equuli]